MNTSVFPERTIGRLAIAIVVATVIGIIAISLFFTIGGVFGPLNDLSIAVEAILSGVLAWRLYPVYRAEAPGWSRLALGAAGLGALLAALGSAFVIFGVTGWYLAGLYSNFGYGLLGLWLFGINAPAGPTSSWPSRLRLLGRVAGAIMAVGLLSIAGIAGALDSYDAAPAWMNLVFLGGLGWFLLYPLWCLWLARLVLAGRLTLPVPATAIAPVV